MLKRFTFQSTGSSEFIDVTEQVRTIVRTSSIASGTCMVYSPHTTAGMTLNSSSDPASLQDTLDEFDRIVPTRATFRHTLDTPADAAGHIKLVMIGNSVAVPIQENDLYLGHSQSILFFELDGPRDREVQVQLFRDDD